MMSLSKAIARYNFLFTSFLSRSSWRAHSSFLFLSSCTFAFSSSICYGTLILLRLATDEQATSKLSVAAGRRYTFKLRSRSMRWNSSFSVFGMINLWSHFWRTPAASCTLSAS